MDKITTNTNVNQLHETHKAIKSTEKSIPDNYHNYF